MDKFVKALRFAAVAHSEPFVFCQFLSLGLPFLGSTPNAGAANAETRTNIRALAIRIFSPAPLRD